MDGNALISPWIWPLGAVISDPIRMERGSLDKRAAMSPTAPIRSRVSSVRSPTARDNNRHGARGFTGGDEAGYYHEAKIHSPTSFPILRRAYYELGRQVPLPSWLTGQRARKLGQVRVWRS